MAKSFANEMDDENDELSYLPRKLLSNLAKFQREGIQFGIKMNGRCLIADEMGLGKTLQALSIAYYYREEWPVLIVVPSSLRYPWIDEMEKWFPDILPEHVNSVESSSDIAQIPSALVTIVSYGLLRCPSSRLVQEALMNQSFKVVIADESHYIKNRKSATSKFLVPLLQQADRKLLLTGTPALNRPEELFPQLTSIDSKLFGNWNEYAKRYCDARLQYYGRKRIWVTDGATNLDELQSLMTESVMIRRLKKDVLGQLPPKQRQKISFRLKDSDVKKDLDKTLDAINKLFDNSRRSISEIFTAGNCREIQPLVSEQKELYRLLSELHMKTCSVKLGPVKSYIEMLCENKELKFIVFAYHRVMMDAICEQLANDSVTFVRIDGSTVPSDRPLFVKQFQTDAKVRVAVLSIKAAGVGLTLTAASLVVFAELDWTPGVLEQCEDRAHRIGQNSTVHVHYLVASGTLDDWVWSALARKTSIVSLALNGKKQQLRMQAGSAEQVSRLSDADVYIPMPQEDIDVSHLLQQSDLRSRGQKSLLQFFSSPKDENSSAPGSSKLHPAGSSSPSRPKRPRLSADVLSPLENTSASPSSREIVLIKSDDSDSDESNFQNDSRVFRTPTSEQTTGGDSKVKWQFLKYRKTSSSTPKTSKSSKRGGGGSGTLGGAVKWNCARCTFLNHPLMNACEICSAVRPNGKRSKDAEERKPGDELSDADDTNRGVANCNSSTTSFVEPALEVSFASGSISGNDTSIDADRGTTENDTFSTDVDLFDDDYATTTSQSSNCYDENLRQSASKDRASSGSSRSGRQTIDANECATPPGETALARLNNSPALGPDLDSSAVVDSGESDDGSPRYAFFQFLCSRHTSRIYLYDQCGTPLHLNFSPIDLQMENYSELPEILLKAHHLQLLKRFVRDWNSLTATKRRLVIKSGRLFVSPSLFYEELKSVGGKLVASRQRFASKAEVATKSMSIADAIGGSVRLITKPQHPLTPAAAAAAVAALKDSMNVTNGRDARNDIDLVNLQDWPKEGIMETLSGFVQAVDGDGNPLCLHCHQPFSSSLISHATMQQAPWLTRLCSRQCMQQFWVRRHGRYAAKQVYDEEHGVCQLCNFDAQSFFKQVEAVKFMHKRVGLIESSIYKTLSANVKERMIRQPQQGLFWHVDHIVAVADGGGQCDVDNLRTLCTVCHRAVTSQQNKDRARQRLLASSSDYHNITNFFKPM